MTKLKIPTAKELQGEVSVAAVLEITKLARAQMEEEDRIVVLETQLADRKKILWRLSTIDIPAAMNTAQVAQIVLQDGTGVEIKNFITGNIKDENITPAHAWLRKNGFGSLIKNAVSVAFGMGDDAKALTVVKFLATKHIPFEQKESVHSSTLRAFIRERLEAGKALPAAIDIITVPTSKINRGKLNHG